MYNNLPRESGGRRKAARNGKLSIEMHYESFYKRQCWTSKRGLFGSLQHPSLNLLGADKSIASYAYNLRERSLNTQAGACRVSKQGRCGSLKLHGDSGI